MTTTAPATIPDRPVRSPARRTVNYCLSATRVLLGDIAFVVFIVGIPVFMFVLFNSLYGQYELEGMRVGAMIMANMAAYAGLGAAINAGATIQTERASGWMRQLMVPGLSPRAFLIGRAAAAAAVVGPAVLAVLIAGATIGQVTLTLAQWAAVLAALWASCVPMALLGVLLGLLLRPSAVTAATTVVLMLLAVLGGLWMPLESFPAWVQTISQYTPARQIAWIGYGAAGGEALDAQGWAVLAAWMIALAALTLLLFRRSARSSRR